MYLHLDPIDTSASHHVQRSRARPSCYSQFTSVLLLDLFVGHSATFFIGSDRRSSITKYKTIMDEHWQSFVLDDAGFELPEDWKLWVIFDEDDEAFKSKPESPRIKCMRFDKYPGFTAPYCATTPAHFLRNAYPDDAKCVLGLESHKTSPLRNIALSNVPKEERGDSGNEGGKEKPARKKVVTFSGTVQVLEIDPDSAVEEQA
jgi:hypothetical protein